jgi:hypothetical protein
LHGDEFLHGVLDTRRKAHGEVLITSVLTLFLVEDVWVFIEVSSGVIINSLDEHLLGGKLEGNLLVVRLETNGRKNLGTSYENSREKVREPSATVSDVIRVALRHGIGPVRNLLQELLEHDENLFTLGGLHGFAVHFLKNFNHRRTHDNAHLT